MSTQTNNESTQSPAKGAFWLALLLILLFITLGFLVKKGYDLRLSGVERAQQEAARKNDAKFDQLSERVGAFTIDDSRAGGTVVVGDGSSTGGSGASGVNGSAGKDGATGPAGPVGQTGATGAVGTAGPAGATGATGPQGIQGPQGPSGVASCPNGTCLSLQGASPGAQEAGSINISGDGTFGGNVNATTITGDGSGITNVNAATLNGNTAGNGSGQIALSNGSLNTNLNADQLDGQHGSFYQSASNLNTGTLSDARLSANVTLQGNAFNGASQLVQLTSGGILPILDGSQLTNVIAANSLQLGGQGAAYYLNASNLSSGTLSDALLSGNVTLQGNTFNGPNQLVRLTTGGILPVIDGSQLTNVNATTMNGQLAAYYLNATNINAGTLADGILSSNVPLKNATNTFSATNNFAGITATGILQNGYSVCDSSNNCSYAASTGSANYIWNGTSTQSANINIRSANPVNVGLVVQGATGQTANLQEWKNAAGSTVASINAAGDQFSFGGGTISVGSGNFTFNLNSIRVPSIRQNTGNLADLGANPLLTWSNTTSVPGVVVTPVASTQRGLAIQGVAGQTANLQEWRNNNGTMLSGVTATGIIQASAGIASTGTLVVNPANGILQLTASGSYNFGLAKGLWRSGSSGIRIGTGGNNLTVRNNADTADLFVILDTTGEVTFTSNVRGYNVGVTSSAATTAVAFPTAHQNANYAVLCTPNWNTTCWVSDKTAAGFTLNYGTAAPSGQLVDWFVVH